MKKLLTIISAFLLCVTAQAGSVITATITVTNAPADGDTITINGSVRTWKTTVTTASSQILIGASIGANATNMFNQFARTPFTTLSLNRSGTNGVTLRGIVDQTITISIAGTWGEYSLATNTTTEAKVVLVPASSYQTQSEATNIFSYITADLEEYSTNVFSDTAALLGNFVSLDEAQDLSNKTISDSTLDASLITNTLAKMLYLTNNTTEENGLQFWAGGVRVTTIAPDANGLPTLYGTLLDEIPTNEFGAYTPSGGNLLTRNAGDTRYGALTLANSWSGTNTFTRITNSTIVNSTITGSTISGTIGTLSSGTIDGSTLTNVTAYGTVGLLSGGHIDGVGSTNMAATNTTLKGVTTVPGAMNFSRTAHTALANGANAAVDFGTATFITIEAGPTAAFSIAGIDNEADGRTYFLINTTGQNMTISHDSGTEPVPAQRIFTLTGADIASTANGMFMVWYDSNQSRWWAAELAD